jgi:hypothetical protein
MLAPLLNPPSNRYSTGVRPNLLLKLRYEPMVTSACFVATRLCELFASLLKLTIALRPGETKNVAT